MTRPDWCPQDVWEAAAVVWMAANVRTIPAAAEPIDPAGFVARAILAERATQHDNIRDLGDCLSDMTEHYVKLINSGDAGHWDPEQESEVLAARKLIAAARGTA